MCNIEAMADTDENEKNLIYVKFYLKWKFFGEFMFVTILKSLKLYLFIFFFYFFWF